MRMEDRSTTVRPLPRAAAWLGLLSLWTSACGEGAAPQAAAMGLPDQVTYSQHVAPILFQNCAGCHRPGEAAPFELLSYKDAKRRAKQIVHVTREGIMPPWLPEPACEEILDERGLSKRDQEILARWFEQGAQEGDPERTPELPRWTEGWQIGEPDLVIELPEPYTLQSDGIDVFHTYVLPIPIEETKYVRVVEVRPSNRKVVHHAMMLLNSGPTIRQLDADFAGPGFPGIEVGEAEWPEGHMPGWLPGRRPFTGRDDIAWRLEPGSDAVLQLHMVPSGKSELVAPKIGFYWAEQAPSREAMLLTLRRGDLDIPAGEANYAVQDDFVLPVDVEILAVQPHAHYLGTRMQGIAQLPDGTQLTLLDIQRWDFNWQDRYEFARPVLLPKGTTLSMHYVFDNSAENERNPSHPPKRVVHGWNTKDEMAELWLQAVPRDPNDLEKLREAHALEVGLDRLKEYITLGEAALRQYPEDTDIRLRLAEGHYDLAQLQSKANETEEAEAHYRESLRLFPRLAKANNNLGLLLAARQDWPAAVEAYELALQAQPKLVKVHTNLAAAQEALGQRERAERHLRRALVLQPERADLHNKLGAFLARGGRLQEALGCFQEALQISPDFGAARKNLRQTRALLQGQ